MYIYINYRALPISKTTAREEHYRNTNIYIYVYIYIHYQYIYIYIYVLTTEHYRYQTLQPVKNTTTLPIYTLVYICICIFVHTTNIYIHIYTNYRAIPNSKTTAHKECCQHFGHH